MEKTFTIGLMISSTDSEYEKEIIVGISSYCEKHNQKLIIFSGRSLSWPYGWEYQKTAIYEHIHKGTIDALIVASGTLCNYIEEDFFNAWIKKFESLPIVSIAIPMTGIPSIVVDNQTGLQKLLDHLFTTHGCKRFGVLTGPEDNSEAQKRMEVFNIFLKEHSLDEKDQTIFKGAFTPESCHESLKPWLDTHTPNFKALVCMNDSMASAALQILKTKGYRVPEDIIVTGFDDIVRSRFENPTLTTVTQDLIVQGNLAASMAHSLIKGEKVKPLTPLLTRPLYRQSCGCIGKDELSQRHVAYQENNEYIDFDAHAFFELSTRLFRNQDDLIHLREYLSNMIAIVSVGDLLDRLPRSLRLLGIETCALVLFEKEIPFERKGQFKLPSVANLVLLFDKYDSNAGIEKTINFDPRSSLLPSNIFSSRPYNLVTTSLFHRDVQLGYLVWEPGNCDPSISETISVQLSSTIRAALLFEAKQEAEARLHLALKDLEHYNTTLHSISRTDELTSLYNRRGFITLGQESMDLALLMEKQGLVVFADMDGLKAINDTWGHDAGDRAIIAMSIALKKTFRRMDIVARMGGDEFAIVALDITKEFVKTLRNRLDTILEEYNQKSGEPFNLSLSLGAIEFSGRQNQKLEELLSLADSVLYEEKKQKRARRGL